MSKSTAPMMSLDLARAYLRRGWSVIPVPHQSKAPTVKGWQRLRISEPELPTHFNGQPMNVGILLGEPSAWLVDVDLDHDQAVALAHDYLPPTDARFGRDGKPDSHWLYRVRAPIETAKHQTEGRVMLVELRATGCQTIAPGSTHTSGEGIRWDAEGEPAEVDADELAEAVAQLARDTADTIGEPLKVKPARKAQQTATTTGNVERAWRYIVKTPDAISEQGGHDATFRAACECFRFGLDDAQAWQVLQRFNAEKCEPAWSDGELRHKLDDARERVQADGEVGARLAEQAPEHQPATEAPGAESGGEHKAEIQITTAEHRVVEETVEAMRGDADLYQRGGALVRVVRSDGRSDGVERPTGAPTIREAPAAHLRERITRVAKYQRFDMRAEQWLPTHPPGWLVSAIAERGEWAGIRPLIGVSDAPALRPDGSIHQTPGYDAATGTLYEPGGARFEAVPDNITREAAHAAALRLLDVVSDFPFATEAHRAAWLAALLTPLARSAFNGPAPLFLADANVRGSGKTLAMRVGGRINTGRELPVAGYAHDPEEMRKKITATAIAGDRLVLLDNLAGPFGNDALDRALTSTQWSDRILGKSQRVELPLLTTWYATGNNVQVAADTARRIIHIRLDVLDEHPEHRAGFAHPDLMQYVTEQRPRLLVDALTVLAGYLRAGRPSMDLQSFGSFEGWSNTVRAAVAWAGLPDPCETQETLAESDTTADALGQLLTAWQRYDVGGTGFTAGELVRKLYPPRGEHWPTDDDTAAMRSAVEAVTGATPSKPPGARQLGNTLKNHRRRVVGGLYLDARPRGKQGTRWRVLAT